MGNNCVCLNKQEKWETPEILTPSKEEFEPSKSIYNNDTYENYKEQAEKESVEKSKVANIIAQNNNNNNFLEEIKSFDRTSMEENFTRDTKTFDPVLTKVNHMDFAMDLFDEINRFRANPDLFVELMEKYPSIFLICI